MKIETKEEKVTYQVYVSEDGQYSRVVRNMTEEQKERVKQDIKDYESSAKCVLFTRLLERNVISELKYTNKTKHDDGTPLTEEEKAEQSAAYLLDNIMDDGCLRSDYYMLTPRTEEDIQDMFKYLSLKYQYQGIPAGDEGEDYRRVTGKVETGKQYILQMNSECECYNIISLPLLQKRIEKMCAFYEKIGKAQMKK